MIARAPGSSTRHNCSRGSPRRARVLLCLAVGLLAFPALGLAAGGSPPAGPSEPAQPPNDPNHVTAEPTVESGDELLMFQDVPVVVSAARRAQPVNWLSVPVSIITAEDIHYSGLTSIPEILQFTPSVDLLKLERNRFAVGVRGMHFAYSDRLLSLVDGRAADQPMFGGPDFIRLPVLMEDIKRIEVVRGPGGAAWGANAFTGVVNIITKEPEETQGWLASTTWSHFCDSYSHLRWGSKAGKWAWRISMGYEDMKTSEDAISGGASFALEKPVLPALIGFDRYVARDFTRNWRIDTKATYRPSDRTKWSFGLGTSHLETGDFEKAGYYAMQSMRQDTARAFSKVEREFGGGRTAHFQWFGNFLQGNMAGVTARTSENDLEGQYNFAIGDDHKMSVGGNARWAHINTGWTDPQDMRFIGAPFDEYWLGAFGIDRWQATKRLVIEAQGRLDWYSETHMDWSARLSGLYALDEAQRHVLRVSGAKAFRSPLIVCRRLRGRTVPLGMGTYLAEYVLPRDDLKNEETWSAELGYTGRITDWLTVRADGYYQRFDRLITYRKTYRPPLPAVFSFADNTGGTSSFGGEAEVELKGKIGTLSAWYAHNNSREDHSHQEVRSFLPAKHKVGVTGRLFLPDGWTLNANYRYATRVTENTVGDATRPWTNRLDLTVSKRLFDGRCEVMFGVWDVLDKTNDPAVGYGQFTAHET
ncbi:MAG: TonB-dependent receptor, partial [Phycisphaerae bacterium]